MDKDVQVKHHLTERGLLNDQQHKSQLNSKIHEDRIIRVHARQSSAELPEETILISCKEHLTKLLINHAHHQTHHAGSPHTLAKLR